MIILYLALLSACAYTLWGVLLKYNDVSKVSVFGFMTPVFGFLLSSLILKEHMNQSVLMSVISLVLVCLGILCVNVNLKLKKKNK